MATVRMLPPAVGANPGNNPLNMGNAGTISCAIGSAIDANEGDVPRLLGSGWVRVAVGGGHGSTAFGLSGSTSGRPTSTPGSGIPLAPGYQYADTDLGAIVIWDGATYRDITGAAV